MNSFSKAQREGLIPFGFHGWTDSGFDAKSTDFRYIGEYMLMHSNGASIGPGVDPTIGMPLP